MGANSRLGGYSNKYGIYLAELERQIFLHSFIVPLKHTRFHTIQSNPTTYEHHRDGLLEKLWGGGGGREFSSRRNFFSLSNSLYEFFLGHGMTIFHDQLTCKNFFHLIFPCANIFLVLRPPPPTPDKFSNGPSV